jgi:nucleoside recognition membrane protein YjiH
VAGFLLALLVVMALIGALIYVMARKDRYATMSEEEFEEEAKKKSLLGAAFTGLESTLRKREATYMMEAKSRIERDATPSPGDPPEEETTRKGNKSD